MIISHVGEGIDMAQRFGRYWLHEKIGHGGMAEIFRATIGPDEQTYAFELAIKRLHGELEKDPKQVGSFLTEADVAKFLRHPNLVQVYEAGIIEGHVYIAMEYIWGFDLARLIDTLRRRRIVLPAELAVYITLQVLRGLDYVHQAKSVRGEPLNIVHRDVTPSNIYVTFRGEVKLGDFGIAKVNRPDADNDDPNVLRGKVHYMPPEVIAGGQVTPAVDLWTLAVTLYEMLTARPLREGVTEAEMMAGRYNAKIPPVHKINPQVDVELSALLTRALSTHDKKRPEDAATFYRHLKTFLSKTPLVVDAPALARFVRAGTNVSGAEPVSKAGDTDFEGPEYLAPIEFSPTQRYEMRHRPRSYARPLMIGVPVALGLAMAAGYGLAQRGGGKAPKSPAAVAAAAARKLAAEDGLEADLLGDVNDPAQQRFRGLVQNGAAQLKAGNFEAARTAFQEALQLRPKSAAAQLGLARALYELGDYAGAERQVTGVTQADPGNARAQYLLGNVLKASGQAPRAKKLFKSASCWIPRGNLVKVPSRFSASGSAPCRGLAPRTR